MIYNGNELPSISSIFTEMKNIVISLTLIDNGHIALSLEIV